MLVNKIGITQELLSNISSMIIDLFSQITTTLWKPFSPEDVMLLSLVTAYNYICEEKVDLAGEMMMCCCSIMAVQRFEMVSGEGMSARSFFSSNNIDLWFQSVITKV